VVTAISVPGTSNTIVAAGSDGVVRIFDAGVQRGFSSGDLFPAPPNLTPIFATPDVVWAVVTVNSSSCLVRLTWDYTGFSGFAQTCNGPWGLPSPEVKVDAGVTYFQSGPDTRVWTSPRAGYVDLANRRIIGGITTQLSQLGNPYPPGYPYNYVSTLPIYNLDSEAQTGIIPASGFLPPGDFAPYSGSQALWSTSSQLLLLDLP
jgi:hypothetical protein